MEILLHVLQLLLSIRALGCIGLWFEGGDSRVINAIFARSKGTRFENVSLAALI